MTEKKFVADLLNEVFEEEALIISGLVATMKVEDDFVWRLMKNLDRLRERVFSELDQIDNGSVVLNHPKTSPHPAIEEFLNKLASNKHNVIQHQRR